MFLTIFTPIYNRGKYFKRLFYSIENQTCKDFEWIILNDGSTDNTKQVVESYINNSKIQSIKFKTIKNGGKQRAINEAVKMADGEYFLIVDSDDWIKKNAVSLLKKWVRDIKQTKDYANFAGVSGLRQRPNGTFLSGIDKNRKVIDATNLERDKYNLQGDMAEAYKTNILRKYPFKVFQNENFITEETVWNKIAADGYKIRWHMVPIYVGDYLSDGLTKNSTKRDIKNFKGLIYSTKMALKLKPIRYNLHYLYYYVEIGKKKSYSYKKLANLIDMPTYSLFIEYILYKRLKRIKRLITFRKKMIIGYLKNILHTIKQRVLWSIKNKTNHTKVISTKASLHAKYDNMVSIGENTVIRDNVSIGYGSYVNFNSWIENTKIGKYCSISDHVNICPAEHDINKPLSSPVLGDGISTKQVKIGNDVLISHNVTILSGTTIENGAIVAAGAVVTKNTHIGEYEIWGGVPARFIKKRFNDDKINLLKHSDIYNKNWNQVKNYTWSKLEKEQNEK